MKESVSSLSSGLAHQSRNLNDWNPDPMKHFTYLVSKPNLEKQSGFQFLQKDPMASECSEPAFLKKSSTPIPNPESESMPHQTGRFHPVVHQMVSDALKPEPWDGDWLELEDWYKTWQLYCEAGCPGLNVQTKAVLFMRFMPKQQKEYLLENYHNLGWTQDDMFRYLIEERDRRVPQHVKMNAWLKLKPKGSSYQHLSNWYLKWKRRSQDLMVNDAQLLDQFDFCVKTHFSSALKEVLKQEQSLKDQHGINARYSLDQKYALVVKEVTVADNVKSLFSYAHSAVSSECGHVSEVNSESESRGICEVASERSDGKCYYCSESGHFARDCSRKRESEFKGRCNYCRKYGHTKRYCPKMKRQGSSSTNFARRGLIHLLVLDVLKQGLIEALSDLLGRTDKFLSGPMRRHLKQQKTEARKGCMRSEGHLELRTLGVQRREKLRNLKGFVAMMVDMQYLRKAEKRC